MILCTQAVRRQCALAHSAAPCVSVACGRSIGQGTPDLGNDVRADRVDAQPGQSPGVGRLIYRPDDDAPAGGVDRVNQRLIDHLAVRPVVASTGGT